MHAIRRCETIDILAAVLTSVCPLHDMGFPQVGIQAILSLLVGNLGASQLIDLDEHQRLALV